MRQTLTITMITALFVCVGCASSNVISYKKLIAQNDQALAELSVGMSKADVLRIMGDFRAKTHNGVVSNPLRTESFMRGNDVYEKLIYITHPHHFYGTVNDSQSTPIVLKNGKVIGWGKDAAAIAGNLDSGTATKSK